MNKSKTILLSFLLLPLVIFTSNSTNSSVKSYVKTEANGGNSKVETNISTNVNGVQTDVTVNQPGEVEVNVNNGKVEVKTSGKITPTIIITGTQKIDVVVEDKLTATGSSKPSNIIKFVKSFWARLFNLFNIKS